MLKSNELVRGRKDSGFAEQTLLCVCAQEDALICWIHTHTHTQSHGNKSNGAIFASQIKSGISVLCVPIVHTTAHYMVHICLANAKW